MKKNKSKVIPLFIILFILLIIIFIANDYIDISETFKGDKRLEYKSSIEILENSEIIGLGEDLILNYNKNSLRFININNRVIEYEYDISEKRLVIGNKRIYMLDEFNIIVINLSGEIEGSINENKEILNLTENSDHIAVFMSPTDGSFGNVVSIYDFKLNHMETENHNKNLVYYDKISEDNYLLGEIYLEDGILASKTSHILKGKLDWNYTCYNEILLDIYEIHDYFILDTDLSLYIIKNGDLIESIDKNIIKDYTINDNKIYLLSHNNIRIIDLDREDGIINLNEEFIGIEVKDKDILIYNHEKLYILNGEETSLEFNSESEMKNIIFFNSNILIQYLEDLYIYDVGYEDKI